MARLFSKNASASCSCTGASRCTPGGEAFLASGAQTEAETMPCCSASRPQAGAPRRTRLSATEKARRVTFGAAAGNARACLVVCSSKEAGARQAEQSRGRPHALSMPASRLLPHLDWLAHNKKIAVLQRS